MACWPLSLCMHMPWPVTMFLHLLGYADLKPCKFLVDQGSPTSQVSVTFLFQNSLHYQLDHTGCQYANLMVSIPSQEGYYTSTDLHLSFSAVCTANVMLSADWLASCQVSTAVNVLSAPPQEWVDSQWCTPCLANGHATDFPARIFFAIFALAWLGGSMLLFKCTGVFLARVATTNIFLLNCWIGFSGKPLCDGRIP